MQVRIGLLWGTRKPFGIRKALMQNQRNSNRCGPKSTCDCYVIFLKSGPHDLSPLQIQVFEQTNILSEMWSKTSKEPQRTRRDCSRRGSQHPCHRCCSLRVVAIELLIRTATFPTLPSEQTHNQICGRSSGRHNMGSPEGPLNI